MKFLKKFNDIIYENVLIIDKDSDFDQEVDWKLSIKISNLWNDYDKGKIELSKYNELLSTKLKENLGELLPKFNEELSKLKRCNNINESIPVWNKIYDIADKNLIELS